ncbi:MAG: hypothetical protein GX654_09350 [Desulfatiglans sp.]|mgnify:CR=1 FL=1|nr:hypothetical protein [Desulfatiglans sp.]
MAINPVGTGSSALALLIASAQTEQLKEEKDIKVMKEALKTQEDLMTGILKSLGIGQNIDVVV